MTRMIWSLVSAHRIRYSWERTFHTFWLLKAKLAPRHALFEQRRLLPGQLLLWSSGGQPVEGELPGMLAEPGPWNETTIQVGSDLRCELFRCVIQYSVETRRGAESNVQQSSQLCFYWKQWCFDLESRSAALPCYGQSFQARAWGHEVQPLWLQCPHNYLIAGMWSLKEKCITFKGKWSKIQPGSKVKLTRRCWQQISSWFIQRQCLPFIPQNMKAEDYSTALLWHVIEMGFRIINVVCLMCSRLTLSETDSVHRQSYRQQQVVHFMVQRSPSQTLKLGSDSRAMTKYQLPFLSTCKDLHRVTQRQLAEPGKGNSEKARQDVTATTRDLNKSIRVNFRASGLMSSPREISQQVRRREWSEEVEGI